MKIVILHLSDTHFKPTNNSIFDKSDNLLGAFTTLFFDMDVLFLVISGDIAFSGKDAEYSQAMSFIDAVRKEIQKDSKKSLNIMMVPGNHDCNHSSGKKVLEKL